MVSVKEIIDEEGYKDGVFCETVFGFCVKVVEVVLECGDCVVVVELSISCSRGQVKGETNDPPLRLFEGIITAYSYGVESC